MRRTNVLQDFLQDLAYAARFLKNAPTYSATIILTIAVGIGATTAIFSVVSAVLLRPLPHKDSNRLLTLMGAVVLLFLVACVLYPVRTHFRTYSALHYWPSASCPQA